MPLQTVESRISYLIAKAKTEDITYDELKDLQTILNRLLDFVDEEVINHFNFRQGVADLSKRFEKEYDESLVRETVMDHGNSMSKIQLSSLYGRVGTGR